MEKLMSLSEILKMGYKQTHANLCQKGNKLFVLCNSCHKWFESLKRPDAHGKYAARCFWCDSTVTLKEGI